MAEGAPIKTRQSDSSNLDSLCADYVADLDSALKTARQAPRDTRLQRERLSMRFARRVKVGDS